MRLLTLAVYALCGLAAIAITLYSRRHPERLTPPGTVLDELMASRTARLVLLVFWWWLGWHFLFGQTIDP